MNQMMKDMLDAVLNETTVYEHGFKMSAHSYISGFMRKPAQKALARLIDEGYLDASRQLTRQGWQYFGLTPKQRLIARLEVCFHRHLELRTMNRRSISSVEDVFHPRAKVTAAYIRQIHHNAEMSIADVYRFLLFKHFDMQQNHEDDLQEIEQQIARAELLPDYPDYMD